MRKAAKLCIIAAILFWLVGLFFLVILSCAEAFLANSDYLNFCSPFEIEGNAWLAPTWIASTVLTLAAFILCRVFKNREKLSWIPFFVALIGAVIALVVGLKTQSEFPVHVGVKYDNAGIGFWDLFFRHLSTTIAGVLTAAAAWLHHTACRSDRIAAENAGYKGIYDLSGEPIFNDDESTIGLDTYAEDFGIKKKPAHRLKRSLRNKKKKEQ